MHVQQGTNAGTTSDGGDDEMVAPSPLDHIDHEFLPEVAAEVADSEPRHLRSRHLRSRHLRARLERYPLPVGPQAPQENGNAGDDLPRFRAGHAPFEQALFSTRAKYRPQQQQTLDRWHRELPVPGVSEGT